MPVPRPVRERCRELLGTDAVLHYVFPASEPTRDRGYLFVVTEHRVTVVSTGRAGDSRPRGVWGGFPRGTRLGPVRRDGDRSVLEFGGTVFTLAAEYIPVVNAADAEVFDPGSLPRDPLPGL